MAGISGVTVAGGVTVIVDSVGHLGTITSSASVSKDAIKPMDRASEAILALKPVTFRYKKELDPEGIPQFGLVAEQVEKARVHEQLCQVPALRRRHDRIITRQLAPASCEPPARLDRERLGERPLCEFACLAPDLNRRVGVMPKYAACSAIRSA